MSRSRILVALTTIVSSFAAQAFAAPFNYDESVTGDLPSTGSLPVFNIDLGLNTVTGITGTNNSTGDLDCFALLVPPGMLISSANVSQTDSLGNMFATSWSVYQGSTIAYGGTLLQSFNVSSPGATVITTVPYYPGTFNVSSAGYSIIGTNALSAYTFSFTAVVPEPASLSLLGLGSMLLVRRRRS